MGPRPSPRSPAPVVICGTTTAIAENAFEKPNAHLIGPGTARTVVGPYCECRSRPTAAIVGRFEKERFVRSSSK